MIEAAFAAVVVPLLVIAAAVAAAGLIEWVDHVKRARRGK